MFLGERIALTFGEEIQSIHRKMAGKLQPTISHFEGHIGLENNQTAMNRYKVCFESEPAAKNSEWDNKKYH